MEIEIGGGKIWTIWQEKPVVWDGSDIGVLGGLAGAGMGVGCSAHRIG